MPRVISDDIAIEYDDTGDGEPVLLLMPGWCAPRAVWHPLLGTLGAGRRVLALDWRSHGGSGTAPRDFGERELARDAATVVKASGARHVVPVALSHAGWVALELRRGLEEHVAGLVLVDWIVGPAPAEFVMTLERMRAADQWRAATEELIRQWAAGVHLPGLDALVAEMITAPASMWDRVAREIEGAYAEHVSPLNALTELAPPVPTLHLHSRLRDREAEAAQWHFAQRHPWFRTRELPARSHFPMFEVPSIMAEEIEAFAESLPMSRHRPRGVRRAA